MQSRHAHVAHGDEINRALVPVLEKTRADENVFRSHADIGPAQQVGGENILDVGSDQIAAPAAARLCLAGAPQVHGRNHSTLIYEFLYRPTRFGIGFLALLVEV